MKSKRQKRIIEIISQEAVKTQDELASLLRSEGIDVTQATVSRDIKELHLIKVARGDGYAYSLPKGQMPLRDENRLRRIFQDAVLRIVSGGNIVVVHTLPGNANSVCSLLDAAEWEEFLGAVAGDDTILIVASTPSQAQILVDRLQGLLEQ